VARYTGLGVLAVSAIAVVAGLAAWGLAVAMIAGWAVPSARRETEDERYVLQGFVGRVTQAIGAGTPGEISYQLEGSWHRVRARSLDGNPIEAGTEIAIERIEDGVAWVERWSTIERQLEIP
jgi:membrane protein implicated in regulation of membrane protease activity